VLSASRRLLKNETLYILSSASVIISIRPPALFRLILFSVYREFFRFVRSQCHISYDKNLQVWKQCSLALFREPYIQSRVRLSRD
jgi:hypothetical protein